MKEKIEKLIASLRIGSKTSERQSDDMIRDISLRAQDEVLAKVYTAFANDLQIILDSEKEPEPTIEEEEFPAETPEVSLEERFEQLEKRVSQLIRD